MHKKASTSNRSDKAKDSVGKKAAASPSAAAEDKPTVSAGKVPVANAGKEVAKTVVAKKADQAPARKSAAPARTRPKGERAEFLTGQQELLLEERRSYIDSAEALKAQADSLALEHEPGDVQFDEEGGEGGTANVDREIDLYLSAQARATVVEIDRALQKIEDGTYGVCEQCGQMIPDARLQALPYAALCVTCKSGGLSSRR